MKVVLGITISAVISYFLGSISSAILFCKIFEHKDIRDYGSHNAGLTNVLRVFGKKCAVFTLTGDVLKGAIAVILSKYTMILFGFGDKLFDKSLIYIGYVASIFAVIGHIYPLYYHFKGGKGVLVAAACLAVTCWQAFVILFGIFLIVLAISKYVSLASIIAAGLYPFTTFFMLYFVYNLNAGMCIIDGLLAAVIGGMIIIMHRTNISRLINGTENKFSLSKKKSV